MQMLWRRRFLRFLKEEGVYGEWVYNIYEQHPICDKKFWVYRWKYELFDEYIRCSHAVDYAFTWVWTREGHTYWRNVHEKWLKICNYRS